MSNIAKANAFIEFIKSLDDKTVPPSAVHTWLMENLDRRESPYISGTWYDNPERRWMSSPLRFCNFRRYANFVHGVLMIDQMMYEFLPGAVYVYQLPPPHLLTPTLVLIDTLPESIHIYYAPRGAIKVYRQFMNEGWVETEWSRDWHKLPFADVPAINGGAIRLIFSRFYRLLKITADDSDLEITPDIWSGSKPEWVECVNEAVVSKSDRERLKLHREGYCSYDPTHPALVKLFRTLEEFETLHKQGLGRTLPDLKAAFKTAAVGALKEITSSDRPKA